MRPLSCSAEQRPYQPLCVPSPRPAANPIARVPPAASPPLTPLPAPLTRRTIILPQNNAIAPAGVYTIGDPVRSAPEPLRGPDYIAEMHERRSAAEDIPVTALAAALGLSSSAAQDAYRRWCEAEGVEPLPGARGRSTWHPWIIGRYLAGFEPAEIAAALTAAGTYAYQEEQVNRCLIRFGVARDPVHKALRAKT